MPRFLNRFYIEFIRPTDPGLFITRYAAKATVCCLLSLTAALLLGLRGHDLLWWLIGALCTILFRTGSTFSRRKMYGLILLGTVSLTVPIAAVIGSNTGASLAFIFILSFACFFVAALGVSASTIGIGCLVVTMISIFSPAAIIPGLIRSAWLMGGGLISFLINFYLWPFDPEKVLLSAAKLAVEDMGLFFDGLCARIKNPRVTDANLNYLSSEASASIRRYRIFMESFNVDPLKGSRTQGGPGLYYFSLVRLFETLMGLFHHIHFCDGNPEFDELKETFYTASAGIGEAFDLFTEMKSGMYIKPDFSPIHTDLEEIQTALVEMKGYQKGDHGQNKFLEAWAALYELKNVVGELETMMALADQRFQLKVKPHAA
ncbi:hypothetical protein [uncultured Desulfobacter sp.]|uniref:hypothetical protein n=1 Tax=uncultured Desulfobacter sp. TaxID=240139 RepID=UPI002AA88F93|nr:hypothetical protein [uncultured Desulfobacter sp.]